MSSPTTPMAPPNAATTVTPAPLPSATASPDNKTKFIIIIVACVGGFVLLIVTVLVVVPLSRRYVERRQRRRLGPSSSPQGSTRSHGHQRMLSGPDASVPLLNSSPDMAMADPPASAAHPRTDPDIELYDPWTLVSDAEAGPSRAGPSRPPPSLRHAKTRITQAPLETLPENAPASPTPAPSELASSSAPIPRPEPTPTPSWLHIPRTGVPLIGAFRASLASSTTSRSRSTESLPSMKHYPSFTAQSSHSETPTAFYSLSSGDPGSSSAGARTAGSARLAATEHGELQRAARLKAAGGAGLMPELHDGARGVASRQASLMYGVGSDAAASSVGRGPSSSRGGNVPGGYPTSGSGSSVSVYTDAKSRLPEEDREREAGRWSPLATWQSYWSLGGAAQR